MWGGEMTDQLPSYSLRISEELTRKLKKLAADGKRSYNKQLELILEEYVRAYEAEHGEIEA